MKNFILWSLIIWLSVREGIKLYMKHYHKFWSQQPVPQYYQLLGSSVIMVPDPLPVRPPPSNFRVEQIPFHSSSTKRQDLLTLINQHFYASQHKVSYSESDLEWIINYPGPQTCHLGTDPPAPDSDTSYPIQFGLWEIQETKRLLGYIMGKPLALKWGDQTFPCLYVDLLCLHPEVRGKKLAPVLISQLAHTGMKQGFKTFIFKIEGQPLSYRHVGVSQQWGYHFPANSSRSKESQLDSLAWRILDSSQFTNYYVSYDTWYHSRKLGIKLTLSQWQNLLASSNTKCWYRKNSGLLLAYYWKLSSGQTCAEIMLVLPDGCASEDLLQSWTVMMENIGHQERPVRLAISSTLVSSCWLKQHNWEPGSKSYFQFYNYYTPVWDFVTEEDNGFFLL